MKRAAALAAFAVLVACSGGGSSAGSSSSSSTSSSSSSSTPSTAATAACPTNFTVGATNTADKSCWPNMLSAVLASEKVPYDAVVQPTQAAAVCRRMTTDGVVQGQLGILTDWVTGAAPSPTADPKDQSAFIAAAVAVYCPQFFEALKSQH